MNKDELKTELYHQKFAVEVSKRYHAHRIDSVIRWAEFLQAVEFVASTAALLSTFAWSMTFTRGLLFLAGLSAGLCCVKKLHTAIAWHYAKKAAFGDLAKRFPVDPETVTSELLESLVSERNEIEKDDGTGLQCLDVLCHNEECLSRGLEGEMKPMTWWQRYLGTLLPLPYHTPRVVVG